MNKLSLENNCFNEFNSKDDQANNFYTATTGIEKQIASMLEKVLSDDDDNERISTMSEGNYSHSSSQESYDNNDCFNFLNNNNSNNNSYNNSIKNVKNTNNYYVNKRPSLFSKNPSHFDEFQQKAKNSNHQFQGRTNKKPHTVNYTKSGFNNERLLNAPNCRKNNNQQQMFNNMMCNENINFIPSDIFSLQLRLKLSSEENPSKY
jgi:hypothetical protein